MRVAFVGYSSSVWTGGYNYILNLCRVLVEYAPTVEPWLFVSPDIPEDDLAPFRSLLTGRIVVAPSLSANRGIGYYFRTALTGRDDAALRQFRRHGIDVVFEAYAFYGWRFPIPTMAWFADFQHREHPEFFSSSNYWRREAGHWLQRLCGRTVIVSSESVGRDAQRYYRVPNNQLRVVRFAVTIADVPTDEECQAARARYGLPERFLFLPNQFWKHKNHEVVVRPLAHLKQHGITVHVAASGNTLDYRQPETFAALARLVTELGVSDRFLILGMIPYADVSALMGAAVAVINPSFSEGWSTTVEEAKALGAKIVLSDIPVHREQALDAGLFFRSPRRLRPCETNGARNDGVFVV